MIAYFGLLSSVSLIFLALALLGYTGRAEESSYLVRELQKLFPSQSITDIVKVVDAITSNATTLGLIGGAFLLWTSLSLFSVLESAFNIVYARPNRPFLRGKFLATLFMAGSLIILTAALILGSFGYDLMQRFTPNFIDNAFVAYSLSMLISTVAVFTFLVAAYERLTNVRLTLREVWPGAALAALLLQATFQVLPIFVRVSHEVIAVQALGASALLLVWIYVMANVIVFGAEVNWWYGRRDEEEVAGRPRVWRIALVAGLRWSFRSSAGACRRRGRGASWRASSRCRARRPSAPDRPGRRSGRSRSPRRRAARSRSSPRGSRCRAAPRRPGPSATSSQT